MAIQKGPSGALGTSIEAGEIATGAVTADKLGTGAVTPAKLSTGAPVWDTSSNVGIGVSAPASKIHISYAGAVNTNTFNVSTTSVTSSPKTLIGANLVLSDDATTYTKPATAISGAGILFDGINGLNSHGSIQFLSAPDDNTGSATPLERMRIDSAGHVIVPNGITLGTAVGTYAAANTLDDYEEGTFTPAFSPSSGSWVSYSSTGQYIKIGRTVTLFMSVTTTNKGTGSGHFDFSGIPFTSFNPTIGAGNRAAIGLIREDSSVGNVGQVFINGFSTNGTCAAINAGAITPQGNGFVYEISIQYITAS